MSISTTANRKVYTGNGSVTSFSFPYLFYSTNDLSIYINGVLTITGFTIATTAVAGGGFTGSVNFTTAPAADVQVLILREVDLKQETVYDVASAFPAKTVEQDLDMAVMMIQQLAEIDTRCIKLPKTSTLTEIDIPDPILTANWGKAIRISADGTRLETVDIGTTPYASVLTTKGDLPTSTGSAQARLPVGADGEILTPDSADANGIKWTTMAAGGSPPSKLIPFISPLAQAQPAFL